MPPQNADFALNFHLPDGQTASLILKTFSVGECANAFFTAPPQLDSFEPKVGYRNLDGSFELPQFTGETNCPFEFTVIRVKPAFPVQIKIDGNTVQWTGPLNDIDIGTYEFTIEASQGCHTEEVEFFVDIVDCSIDKLGFDPQLSKKLGLIGAMKIGDKARSVSQDLTKFSSSLNYYTSVCGPTSW